MPRIVFYILLLVFSSISINRAESINTSQYIESSHLIYETNFSVNSTITIWSKLLDNLFLFGNLWDVYEFTPNYKVGLDGTGIYVFDSSGIDGKLNEIHPYQGSRVFSASGMISSKKLNLHINGDALFLVKSKTSLDYVDVNVRVYLKGTNKLANAGIKTITPIISKHVENRVENVINNSKIILSDIERNPEKIRTQISGQMLKDFNSIIQEPELINAN